MRQFQILACVGNDGIVRRKFLVTKIEFGGLSEDAAKANGFTLEEDHWVREVTSDVIAHETRYEKWADTKLFPTVLGIIDGQIEQSPDFPAPEFKDAWVLTKDGRVIHDAEKLNASKLQEGLVT